MNFQKYFKSTALINNPLCGIDTYKDVLNLATGQITRAIKKVMLTGNENCSRSASSLSPNAFCYAFTYSEIGMLDIIYNDFNMANIPYPHYVCSHFKMKPSPSITQDDEFTNIRDGEVGANSIRRNATGSNIIFNRYIILCTSQYSTIVDFKAWLAAEYANGTPITIWYILETPETEQITVPSGLSETVEGYLTQDGTPTPTDPIYPVAKDAVGWYGIKNYVRATTWQDGSTYSRSGGSWSAAAKKRSRKKK